ncbi:MAG: cytochrome C biogenesis protein CycH [Bacteroidetes bacterium]|nr:MAG: cytochrome C biogenesis protein CycH [Bacteroidota bacterium]
MKQNTQTLLYNTPDGRMSIEVNLREESVWLSQKQIGLLFERDYKTISKHIGNVFREGELERSATVANFATVQMEGEREVVRDIEYYNLDVIISVGYRVKSQRGTNFRIWATQVLRRHLLENAPVYTPENAWQERYMYLLKTIDIAATAAAHASLSATEATGIIKVLHYYAYALETLDKYDHQQLSIEVQEGKEIKPLLYEEAMQLIREWRTLQGGSALFGNEKDASFKSSLESIYQTFGGSELYPSVEEKAANLLYFIVKNHSFSDGNKRIAAGLFVYFLDKNHTLFRPDGSKRIGDNALVAITIMTAESKPEEKDIMAKLVVNLINDRN